MTDIFVGWFLFIGVMAITAVIFGGWVIGRIAQGLGRMLGLIPPRPTRMPPPQLRGYSVPQSLPSFGLPAGSIQCRIAGCRHVNPLTAKFCRHCGHAFPQIQSAPASSQMSREALYR